MEACHISLGSNHPVLYSFNGLNFFFLNGLTYLKFVRKVNFGFRLATSVNKSRKVCNFQSPFEELS